MQPSESQTLNNTMQKTKKEIILETAAFYGEDPSRRALINQDVRAKCRYLTEDGRKCAVGRCLIDGGEMKYANLSEKITVKFVDADVAVGCLYNLEDILMPEYRGHDMAFWGDIQNFHDSKKHFTDTGLSEIGEKEINSLLDFWGDVK